MTIAADLGGAEAAALARRAMIDSQLRVSGVIDETVLARMGAVPREDYVPETARSYAYIDRAIPLGKGRALPAPLVHGMLLREAAPQAADTALVVSSGSGYLAALLKPLVARVDQLDPAEALDSTGSASYSLIVIEGAAQQVPSALIARLAEGGRLVTGLVQGGVTRLAVGRKLAGAFALVEIGDVGMPVIAEFSVSKSWSF